jgi:hypothetical protein
VSAATAATTTATGATTTATLSLAGQWSSKR